MTGLLIGIFLLAAPLAARTDTLHLNAARTVELALTNDNQVELARQKLVEAAAGRVIALGSFLPQLSATGSYYRMAKANEFTLLAARETVMGIPVFDPMGNYIGSTAPIPVAVGVDTFRLKLGSENNYTLRGTIQQTLFTWGKLVNAYRIANLNLNVQAEAIRQSRAQLAVQATETFFQALLTQEMSGLMRESYEQLQRHVARAQTLYDNGLATRLDVMRASVGLANLEVQLSQVETGARLALAALRNIVGAPPEQPVALDGELAPESLSFDLTALIDTALARRPELLQLRRTAQIAELACRIAATSNLPNAFGAFNYDYKRPVGFNDEWGSDWSLTAGLSWPLFTGGANLARYHQARARLRQTRVATRLLEDGIRLEVQAQFAATQQETKNAASQSRGLALAQEAMDLAEQRYQHGLLTNLEYLDTQLAYTQSRLSYLTSLANFQIAKTRLMRAVGRL